MYSFRKVNNHIQIDLISKGSKTSTKVKLIQDNIIAIESSKLQRNNIFKIDKVISFY